MGTAHTPGCVERAGIWAARASKDGTRDTQTGRGTNTQAAEATGTMEDWEESFPPGCITETQMLARTIYLPQRSASSSKAERRITEEQPSVCCTGHRFIVDTHVHKEGFLEARWEVRANFKHTSLWRLGGHPTGQLASTHRNVHTRMYDALAGENLSAV